MSVIFLERGSCNILNKPFEKRKIGNDTQIDRQTEREIGGVGGEERFLWEGD